jgi:hypothetical protein
MDPKLEEELNKLTPTKAYLKGFDEADESVYVGILEARLVTFVDRINKLEDAIGDVLEVFRDLPFATNTKLEKAMDKLEKVVGPWPF